MMTKRSRRVHHFQRENERINTTALGASTSDGGVAHLYDIIVATSKRVTFGKRSEL